MTCYDYSLPVDPNAPRKRRSRWGEVKTEIPGLPTAISAAGVSQSQLDNYAIHLRLEEINRKLRLNDFIPPERERLLFLFFQFRICFHSFLDPLHLLLRTTAMVAGLTPAKSATARNWKTNESNSLIVP